MEFNFVPVNSLPRLAWCANIRREENIVAVFHGPWIETNTNFFCDGAWDGDFLKGDFESTVLLMGFGGKISGDKVLFASPCHTLERLYLIRNDNEIFISSSLSFLLSLSETKLDKNYVHYHADFMTIISGLKKYVRSVPTQDGNSIRLYYYTNLLINSNLEIKESPKRIPDEFTDFASYRSFLEMGVASINKNANAEARKIKYQPITTISTGYDSSTASVLATTIGCKEAVTIRSSRKIEKSHLTKWTVEDGPSDSGKEIADRLGLNIFEYDRNNYLLKKDFPEAEFLACGLMGAEMYMKSFEDKLVSKMLFTGFYGDVGWSKKPKEVSPNIVRGDSSGCSIGEFRMRVGFIHIPVPLFGAVNLKSIHRITNSKEMIPWTTKKPYDRPIARRIIEEYGIPGNLFGQDKKAVDTVLPGMVEQIMAKESCENYVEFYTERSTIKSWIFRWFHNLGHYMYRSDTYKRINNRLKYSRFRIVFLGLKLPKVSDRFFIPLGFDYLAFQWGIQKLLPRYQIPDQFKDAQQNIESKRDEPKAEH